MRDSYNQLRLSASGLPPKRALSRKSSNQRGSGDQKYNNAHHIHDGDGKEILVEDSFMFQTKENFATPMKLEPAFSTDKKMKEFNSNQKEKYSESDFSGLYQSSA